MIKLSPEILSVTQCRAGRDLDVALDKVELLSPGAAVEVELPDDTTSRRNGRRDRSGGRGEAGRCSARRSRPACRWRRPSASLDAAPVDVVVTTSKATGVLVVPIRALVALAEGGYAVEKVSGASTQLDRRRAR